MFKFFVKTKLDDQHFQLDPETLGHIKVARIKSDEEFIAIHNGTFYRCLLVNKQALIVGVMAENNEIASDLTLGVALIAPRGWEFLLEKATELGVRKIVPLITKFTAVKAGRNGANERWNRITQAAAAQAFRNEVPEITAVMRIDDFLLTYGKTGKFANYEHIIASEYERGNSEAAPAFFPAQSVFLVGPEGGFSAAEIATSCAAGFKPISLGRRILKTETASLLLLSRVKP